jgi:hypothetical protein
MEALRNSRSSARRLLVPLIIGASLAACAVVGRPVDPVAPNDAGMQTWSQRLEAQAAEYRQARMWQAWTLRLDAHADAVRRAKVSSAWSERLTKLAEYYLADR